MQALVLGDDGVRWCDDWPVPVVTDGEVRVKVRLAGVCETDLQLVRGYLRFRGVLGHEFVGTAQDGTRSGERVVGEINVACETCDICRKGLPRHCQQRSVLGILGRDGAFAETLVLPERNLHVVPGNVSDEAAVFTEPLAAAFRIAEQISLKAGSRAIVLGDGRLGNLCAQVLALHGLDVCVVGKHAEKLARITALGIAGHLLDPSRLPRADLVVDCTGSRQGLEMALRMVEPCGTVILKTTVAETHDLAFSPVVIDEVTIVGSRCGPFQPALEALAAGVVSVLPLIDARFPLAAGVAALEQARQPGVMKCLLEIGA